MSKFKKKKGGELPAISTASLPDIVFMLLFFFMVATVMRDSTLMVANTLPAEDQKIFRYIKNTQSILEKDVFSKILKLNKLSYHKHVGFWQCMDTARDKSELEKVLR